MRQDGQGYRQQRRPREPVPLSWRLSVYAIGFLAALSWALIMLAGMLLWWIFAG
jgi:hypothetical protein